MFVKYIDGKTVYIVDTSYLWNYANNGFLHSEFMLNTFFSPPQHTSTKPALAESGKEHLGFTYRMFPGAPSSVSARYARIGFHRSPGRTMVIVGKSPE